MGPTQLPLPRAVATRATLPTVTKSKPLSPSQRATVGSSARTAEGAVSRAFRHRLEGEVDSGFSMMALLGMITSPQNHSCPLAAASAFLWDDSSLASAESSR